MTPIDSPSRLRALAAKRHEQAETTQALRIPLVLDQDAADAAEDARLQREAFQASIEHSEDQYRRALIDAHSDVRDLEDALADREESEAADAADVRGNGTDTTDLSARLEKARAFLTNLEEAREGAVEAERAELQRLREAEKAARATAAEGIIHLVFKRLPSARYEQLLMQHGGSEMTTVEQERPFLDALLLESFLRIEYPDGSQETPAWSEVIDQLTPSQGELGAWRTMCFSHQARAGVDVPFALRPSVKTRSS